MKTEQQTAPRGKAFGVFRLSHVAGAIPVQVVNVGQPTKERDEAARLARSIDWRLVPTIALVAALTACGGGGEPLQGNADGHTVSTIPVDCGGGIACK